MARLSLIHACAGGGRAVREQVESALEPAGRRVVWLDSDDQVASCLSEIEVLLCTRLPLVDWARAARLRLIQVLGSGVEGAQALTALPAGAWVANARGIHAPEIRDHVLAMILAFERDLPRLERQRTERRWERFAAGSVVGRRVAVLGLGPVGQAVAQGCQALGMVVLGVRARPAPTEHVQQVHGPDRLLDVLARADYVVVCVPKTAHTVPLLGELALSALGSHAVLIAVSRGGVVDQDALERALRAGRLRGAALDVFEQEPLAADSPFWELPNVILSPHLAGWTGDYHARAVELFLRNLEEVEQGEPPETAVDPQRGY